jgi:hypothetical protein
MFQTKVQMIANDFFEVGFIKDIHAFQTLAWALNTGTGNDDVCV